MPELHDMFVPDAEPVIVTQNGAHRLFQLAGSIWVQTTHNTASIRFREWDPNNRICSIQPFWCRRFDEMNLHDVVIHGDLLFRITPGEGFEFRAMIDVVRIVARGGDAYDNDRSSIVPCNNLY